MKTRNVFLFGAGAALAWGGPTTGKLTEIIRKAGFRMKGNETKITEYIYNTLIRACYQPWEANFETIINVIEEFNIYYSSFTRAGKLSSIFRIFMDLKNADDLLNFAVHGEKKHRYKLEIPAGRLYEDSERSFIMNHLSRCSFRNY